MGMLPGGRSGVATLRRRNAASPKRASASSNRTSISARGRPRFSRPKITSFSTVVASSCAAGFWNTIPARSVSCHSGIVAVGNASIHTAPRISLR